ncbi:MAG TPA: HAD hydrolase family protein [Gemmatimonadales bacterium]|nr:HAD hydrolase family protein [Gemmatimonadales bacterium]
MPYPFGAVALDYDGTLTSTGVPAEDTIAALVETRAAGRCVVLVTGRILSELTAVFPAVTQYVDAIVAENGAVLWTPPTGARPLAAPVSAALETVLRRDGVPLRRGLALLATSAEYDLVVERHIGRLGLEEQVVRNRGELMILPPGVTKGSGLRHALAELGRSVHDAIGIGDAENDHSLLEACELGVAVADAVPSLRAHADLVLPEPDGAGVTGFLRGPVLSGAMRPPPHHWRVRLGAYADGAPATVPASRINLLVAGGSGSGKSCLMGLLAERLSDLGYSLLILDPEGDHAGLAERHGFLRLGGSRAPPTADELSAVLAHKFGSVVVDLSQRPIEERGVYGAYLVGALEAMRAQRGLPHWLLVDEAHQLLQHATADLAATAAALRGLCLVTYHPAELPAAVLGAMDRIIALAGTPDLVPLVLQALGRGPSAPPRGDAAISAVRQAPDPATSPPRSALLIDHDFARPFTMDLRATPHARHRRKYLEGQVPWPERFFFRNGGPASVSAGNLAEFQRALSGVDEDQLRGYVERGDFSRWVGEVLDDAALAAELSAIERVARESSDSLAAAREALASAIQERLP